MTMESGTPLADARALFGDDILGPDEVGRELGADPRVLAAASPQLLDLVPFDRETLRAAHARGELLVFRVPADGDGPLTVLRIADRFPDAIDAKLRKGVGYLLKDEWTLDSEPFTGTANCNLEWRLIGRAPIPATCNLSFELQDAALARHAAAVGLAGKLRRRSGVEIVYDTVLFARARGVRLLERTWDWSDTPTADGGYVTAGELAAGGLHVLGYSRAVRFGTLGICGQH
jgi:hypothetical protein